MAPAPSSTGVHEDAWFIPGSGPSAATGCLPVVRPDHPRVLDAEVAKFSLTVGADGEVSHDAIRAGVISVEALPEHANAVFGRTSGSRITAFVTDVVDFNWRVATGEGQTWHDAVGNGIAIGMSPDVLAVVDELRDEQAPYRRVVAITDARRRPSELTRMFIRLAKQAATRAR